jgi:hypothetical protein
MVLTAAILFPGGLQDIAAATTRLSWINFQFIQHVKKPARRGNRVFRIVRRDEKYGMMAPRSGMRALVFRTGSRRSSRILMSMAFRHASTAAY